ncbi:hypothetical protein ACFU9X_23120 [Streptomyces atratus]|uniref:hypothetical protein n=1 Tax=Streptomyces atratus TaxID=1893 RepID=UPI0036BA3CC1
MGERASSVVALPAGRRYTCASSAGDGLRDGDDEVIRYRLPHALADVAADTVR